VVPQNVIDFSQRLRHIHALAPVNGFQGFACMGVIKGEGFSRRKCLYHGGESLIGRKTGNGRAIPQREKFCADAGGIVWEKISFWLS
jgi:hypothetical protein